MYENVSSLVCIAVWLIFFDIIFYTVVSSKECCIHKIQFRSYLYARHQHHSRIHIMYVKTLKGLPLNSQVTLTCHIEHNMFHLHHYLYHCTFIIFSTIAENNLLENMSNKLSIHCNQWLCP